MLNEKKLSKNQVQFYQALRQRKEGGGGGRGNLGHSTQKLCKLMQETMVLNYGNFQKVYFELLSKLRAPNSETG